MANVIKKRTKKRYTLVVVTSMATEDGERVTVLQPYRIPMSRAQARKETIAQAAAAQKDHPTAETVGYLFRKAPTDDVLGTAAKAGTLHKQEGFVGFIMRKQNAGAPQAEA